MITEKEVNQKLSKDDIKTLNSIHDAWQEIENCKSGKAKASKFFIEFAKW